MPVRFAPGAVACLLLSLSPWPALAQEETLRRAFEGKTVTVKLDMPGDDSGINIYLDRQDRLDYRKLGESIKRYGAAVRKGEPVMITKVRLKPKLIEFQLAGGGFGSWGDMAGRPSVPNTYISKSNREKDLEKQRDGASADQRRQLDRELDDVRRQREREQQRLRGIAARAQVEQEEWEVNKRLRSGSRFNLHYPDGVPEQAAGPQGVMDALREFVDFSEIEGPPTRPRTTLSQTTGGGGGNPSQLRKGMSLNEVDQLLGAPRSVTKGEAAGLPMVMAIYDQAETTVTAQFVNGVLAKYTISTK